MHFRCPGEHPRSLGTPPLWPQHLLPNSPPVQPWASRPFPGPVAWSVKSWSQLKRHLLQEALLDLSLKQPLVTLFHMVLNLYFYLLLSSCLNALAPHTLNEILPFIPTINIYVLGAGDSAVSKTVQHLFLQRAYIIAEETDRQSAK